MAAGGFGSLQGVASCLVRSGVLTEDVANKAMESAKKSEVSLVRYISEHKLASGIDVAFAIAKEFGVPFLDISTMDIESMPIKMVDEKLMKKHGVVPLCKRGNRLYLAVSDPMNLQALEEIRFHTNYTTDPVVVEHDKLAKALSDVVEKLEGNFSEMLSADVDLDNVDIQSDDDDVAKPGDEDKIDQPVVRFVNKILIDAINKGVSDIHFEPYEKSYRIRYRQDGILHEVATPPVSLSLQLAARLKVMSKMDIAERRVPQDGRIKMVLSKTRSIDFRVNTCPTLWGEKIVLRILDPSSTKLGIEVLGFDDKQQQDFLTAINRPYGMILVTGPTGSGKTVTLYTGLNLLNTADRNISTAEDPVEMNVLGINQVNVNVKTGLTFATALRAFLRQDPDIIMVGEIRDLETAEIAVKAAQTGHMVLSTLHTNDAPQTLSRLANMGVPPYNIASAVNLIMAQRLARKLCEHCKKPADIPSEALRDAGFEESELPGLKVYEAVGCDKCTGGYKGRVGIFQVMPVSEEMGKIIMSHGNAIELADQAEKEGVSDLRRSGLNKVKLGITSLEELNRVTKD